MFLRAPRIFTVIIVLFSSSIYADSEMFRDIREVNVDRAKTIELQDQEYTRCSNPQNCGTPTCCRRGYKFGKNKWNGQPSDVLDDHR